MDGKIYIFTGTADYSRVVELVRMYFADEAEKRGVVVVSSEMTESDVLKRIYKYYEPSVIKPTVIDESTTWAKINEDRIIDSFNKFELGSYHGLKEEREWRKQEPKQMNKDGHSNPNRVHKNTHSSKINNRERSKKKRQSKKRNR